MAWILRNVALILILRTMRTVFGTLFFAHLESMMLLKNLFGGLVCCDYRMNDIDKEMIRASEFEAVYWLTKKRLVYM